MDGQRAVRIIGDEGGVQHLCAALAVSGSSTDRPERRRKRRDVGMVDPGLFEQGRPVGRPSVEEAGDPVDDREVRRELGGDAAPSRAARRLHRSRYVAGIEPLGSGTQQDHPVMLRVRVRVEGIRGCREAREGVWVGEVVHGTTIAARRDAASRAPP